MPSAVHWSKNKLRQRSWRRHLRTTREGKVFVLVTLGVGLAAFNTGNNLLFLVLGFMLSLIVLSGVMSEGVLRHLELRRRLPARAFAHKPCLIEVELRNDKTRRPSYSLEVEDIVAGASTERRCYYLKVGPSETQVAGYRRVPLTRGLLRFTGFRVATRYPFGIFEKWRILAQDGELVVFPALLPEGADARQLGRRGNEASAQRRGWGHEVGGLREYRPGDEARNIHWIRSAALSRIVVRERQSDTSAQLTLLLDNARPTDPDEDWRRRFEHAVSRAATMVVQSVACGTTVEVIGRGTRSPVVFSGASPDPVLRYLALLQPVPAEAAEPFGRPSFGASVVDVSVEPGVGAA